MRATNSIPALAAGTRPKDKEADDEQGGEKMTPDLLRRLALAHDGYETPSLNDRLYLHFRGFHRIENLNPYSNLKALWLDSNGLTEEGIGEGLRGLTHLRCLYLQNNLLESLGGGGRRDARVISGEEGNDGESGRGSDGDGGGGGEGGRKGERRRGWLSGLINLVTLDVSHNRLASLEGVEECIKLTTLLVAKNRLGRGGWEGGGDRGGKNCGGGVEESKGGGKEAAVPRKLDEISVLSPSITISTSSSFSSSLSISEAAEHIALLPLASLPSLHTLDISNNHLIHATRVLLPSLHPSLLPSLLSLTMEGNPFMFPVNQGEDRSKTDINVIKNKNEFRKLCLLTLPQLKYLDRPIFPIERAVAEGWRIAGSKGGEGAREAWMRKEQEGHRESLRVYREWARKARREAGGEEEGTQGEEEGDDVDDEEREVDMRMEVGGGGGRTAAAEEDDGLDEQLEQGKKAAATAAATAAVAAEASIDTATDKIAEEDEGGKEGWRTGKRTGKISLEGGEGEEVPPLYDVSTGHLVINVE
ncbi:hypothetical protein VYU27_008416 [Nannochloropsis oceanica]